MADIDLLLLPQHAVRQRLQQINEAINFRDNDTLTWLKNYFYAKYSLKGYLDEPYPESALPVENAAE